MAEEPLYMIILGVLKIPCFTFIGAFTLYVLNRLNDKMPFSFYTAINIPITKDCKPSKIICDMFVSSLLGVLVVVPLVQPETIPQAIIAGLGMTGILSTYTKKETEGENG